MDAAEPRLAQALRFFDERQVLEHFHSSSGAKYRVTRVIPAGPPSAVELNVRSGSDMVLRYERRRGQSAGSLFDLQLPDTLDPADRSAKHDLIALLKKLFKQWTPTLAGPGLKRVNVIPVWHGACGDAIKSIAEYGFAALARADSEDPGYFAHGRYNALEAAYACFYATDYPEPKAPNSHGEFSVLLSAAVIGVAYPITPGRHDFPTGPLPPIDADKCRFFGKPFEVPCDTHIVGVSWPDFLATDPGSAQYHELVSSQDAQLVPIATVLFTKGGAAAKDCVAPLVGPTAEVLPAAQGALALIAMGDDARNFVRLHLGRAPRAEEVLRMAAKALGLSTDEVLGKYGSAGCFAMHVVAAAVVQAIRPEAPVPFQAVAGGGDYHEDLAAFAVAGALRVDDGISLLSGGWEAKLKYVSERLQPPHCDIYCGSSCLRSGAPPLEVAEVLRVRLATKSDSGSGPKLMMAALGRASTVYVVGRLALEDVADMVVDIDDF